MYSRKLWIILSIRGCNTNDIINGRTEKKLLKMLVADKSYNEIRQNLGLSKNYNLRSLCEYHGGKIWKAYQLHINNVKNEVAVANNLTREDFLRGMDLMLSNIKSITEEKQDKIGYEVIDLNELPKVLPERLQGENYQIKQTSVKLVENVWVEFGEFSKEVKGYNSIQLLSLALVEFLDKYRVKK